MKKIAECQCLPKGIKGAILDAKLDENGKSIWECRNCHHITFRKTRLTAKRKAAHELLTFHLNQMKEQ